MCQGDMPCSWAVEEPAFLQGEGVGVDYALRGAHYAWGDSILWRKGDGTMLLGGHTMLRGGLHPLGEGGCYTLGEGDAMLGGHTRGYALEGGAVIQTGQASLERIEAIMH